MVMMRLMLCDDAFSSLCLGPRTLEALLEACQAASGPIHYLLGGPRRNYSGFAPRSAGFGFGNCAPQPQGTTAPVPRGRDALSAGPSRP